MPRKPLSGMHPILYHMSVFVRQTARHVRWLTGKVRFARTLSDHALPYRVKKHQSVLVRKLGDSDMWLQENKVVNLRLAVKKLSGIVIRPGETFSFCYLVGRPTKKKGYQNGMVLLGGEAHEGVGGGLCQIANLINWLVLHSPLTVTERHHHSFDPFPDEGRVVPFGSGATIFYNYLDYQFTNNTPYIFQLKFWFDDKCLNGDLRVSEDLPFCYHVFEKAHRFVRLGDEFYRQNEIWRRKLVRKGGEVLDAELLIKNFSRVKYTPEAYETPEGRERRK